MKQNSGDTKKVVPQLWHGKSKRIYRGLKGLTAAQQPPATLKIWQSEISGISRLPVMLMTRGDAPQADDYGVGSASLLSLM